MLPLIFIFAFLYDLQEAFTDENGILTDTWGIYLLCRAILFDEYYLL